MQPLDLGDVQVTRVVESETLTSPRFLFPHARREHFSPHLDWLAPHFYEPEPDRLRMSIHAFVVRTGRHTILVDTCVGNDKVRGNPFWNGLRTDFLADLAGAGVTPEQVDYVLCTHLHVDHVGWNTRLADGRWVPTFPNARYVFSRTELAHWQAHADAEERAVLADSVTPVLDAGQVHLVDGAHALAEGVHLVPTPGHTPGHVSVRLQGASGEAVITGDLMHHPIQIALPDWCSQFCVDPPQAVATRQRFLAEHADRPVTVLGTHFAAPTAGRLVHEADGYRLLAGPA